MRYTTRDGRRAYMTIGKFPIMSTDQARVEARKHLVVVDQGGDPKAERDALRGESTVAELVAEYLDRHAKPKKSSWRRDKRRLERHVLPAWRTRRAASITRAEVARLHSQIGRDVGHVAANRLLEVISTMYKVGEIFGCVPDGHRNPAVGVERFDEEPRDRWLSGDEIERLVEAIDAETQPAEPTQADRVQEALALDGPMRIADLARAVELDYYVTASQIQSLVRQGRAEKIKPGTYRATSKPGPRDIGPTVRAALWLYLLLGVRRGELLKARWEHVDLTEGSESLWIPSEHRKSRKPKRVSLPAQAVAILKGLERYPDNPHILAGSRPGKRLGGLQRRWEAVRQRAVLEDVRLHDLRRTVASSVAQSGHSLLVLQQVLGHRNIKSTLVYAHLGSEPDRAALEQHAAKVLAAAERRPPAPVVPIRDGKQKHGFS